MQVDHFGPERLACSQQHFQVWLDHGPHHQCKWMRRGKGEVPLDIACLSGTAKRNI